MKHTSKLVLTLTAMLATAGALAAAPTQSGVQQFNTGRAMQSPTAQQKVAIPVAPPNPIPISSVPYVITQEGYYQLTQDVEGVAGSHGIRVLASNVIIDLNGFSLGGGSGGGTLSGIQCLESNMTVFNGMIFGWGEDGIFCVLGCTVLDVTSVINKGFGMKVGPRSIVQDCSVTRNDAGGIRGQGLWVSGSRVVDNKGHGIESTHEGLVVVQTGVESNEMIGIFAPEPDPTKLGGNPSVIEDCQIIDNGLVGIDAASFAQVRRCFVSENLTGMRVGESSHVADCLVYRNHTGIAVSDSIVERCIVRDNVTGMDVAVGSSVFECEVTGNTGDGLTGTSRVTVRNCSVRDNQTGIVLQGGGGRVEGCTVTDNQDVGISVFDDMIVVNNDVVGNQDRGIRALRSGNRIESNHVTRNGTGIEVLGERNLIVRNSLDSNGVQMQIAADNMQGPFLKTKGFIDTNPWANFDLSFPVGFP